MAAQIWSLQSVSPTFIDWDALSSEQYAAKIMTLCVVCNLVVAWDVKEGFQFLYNP